MGAWLLEMWELFDGFAQDKSRKNRVNVNFLPGWAYAKALALRAQEDAKKDKVRAFGPVTYNGNINGGCRSTMPATQRSRTRYWRSLRLFLCSLTKLISRFPMTLEVIVDSRF